MSRLTTDIDGSWVTRLIVKFLLRLWAETKLAEKRARRDRYFMMVVLVVYCYKVTWSVFFFVDIWDKTYKRACLYMPDLAMGDRQEYQWSVPTVH
jgi:hypothetical protein